jgi:hypothetical protein
VVGTGEVDLLDVVQDVFQLLPGQRLSVET